ncbi:MAG: Ig-like domain-containing protein [Muribaculaceae bacterium]|nr:Ig-like domain-containing protein [Roseburia sp.]MCM1431762.1 Ig-like domain-containing protein [Muribaculaceae bacterium]MCM1493372.1 Ig-like domain-containing protein [Muribaculaceae bacterium]
MKKSVSKRVISLVLALAMVVGGAFYNVTPAKAATVTLATVDNTYVAAGQEYKIDFTLTSTSSVEVDFIVTNPSATEICVYNSAGVPLDWSDNPFYISATDYMQVDSIYGYIDVLDSLSPGDYTYGVKFESDTYFMAEAYAATADPKISQTSATVTVGFTKKLSVTDGTVEKWSSSKTSIAKVDKNGKVTAKKKGTATITATLTDGTKLKCKVKVVENKYTESKYTVSDVPYGDWNMQVYKATFDKNGNLVLNVNIVNGMYNKIVRLDNLKITVKDANGKTVGVYKASKKSISVGARSTKTTTFTIKKSALKKKNADLRNCTISIPTSVTARYYY